MSDDFDDYDDYSDYGDSYVHGQCTIDFRWMWSSTFSVAFLTVVATMITAVCLWNSCVDLLVLATGETTYVKVTRVERKPGRDQFDNYFFHFPDATVGKSYYLFSGVGDKMRGDDQTAITPWATPNRKGGSTTFKVAYLPGNAANYFIMEDSSLLARWIVTILGVIICPLLILRFNRLVKNG